MFKKAQQSVAHNSSLPTAFGVGKNQKSLQDIINSEKDFIKSNSRSSQEFHKAAESIKIWADAEGEDLQDVLGKLSLLLEHYTTSQNRFNNHLSTIRQHFKSIRTREESLADMKGKKRSLGSKIEGVEKRLAKMGPENKELMKTTASLKDLRSEMEGLRIEVQTEEAAIGDFKRRTTKEAMGIKCGGLLELAEKMTIVAEVGKLMIEEIPLDYTHPGMPRAQYLGGTRIDQLMQEATRSLADVGFAPIAGSVGGGGGGVNRQDTSGMRGSEWDESGQDYSLPEGAHDGSYANYAAGEEVDESRQLEDPDTSTTPIYATHSSVNRGREDSVPAVSMENPEDTAAEEWRRARIESVSDTGMYNVNSSTPIADQFASLSRSPDDVQVGGTGLRMVGGGDYNDSNEALERPPVLSRYEGAPHSPTIHNGAPLPSIPRLATPSPQDYSLQTPEENYTIAPAVLATPLSPSFTNASAAQDDASYFQSVGSTRAAQQAVRRPTSQSSNSVNTPQSIAGAAGYPSSNQVPSGTYEPQPEGRKMTAAAFRKGFARAPSNQHVPTSTSNLGGAHYNGSSDHGGYGAQDDGTAPLAIRKRLSAANGPPGTHSNEDHAPAPPYDNSNQLSQAYGGYSGAEEFAPPMPPYGDAHPTSSHPIPGQFYAQSFNGSRPGSAADWRTPNH
ncbi:hypothetical protein CBS101457_006081 [Exobasidium rhododendri]|nr:hypothetical protein CBS101457_006081 [Exobasidium rhododendri]